MNRFNDRAKAAQRLQDLIADNARCASSSQSLSRAINTTGAPDRIRTCDPWLRKPILYPTELRARERSILAIRTPRRPPQRSVRAHHGIIFRLAAPAADCLSPREYEGIRPAQLSDQIAKAAHHRGSAGVCRADCR